MFGEMVGYSAIEKHKVTRKPLPTQIVSQTDWLKTYNLIILSNIIQRTKLYHMEERYEGTIFCNKRFLTGGW